MSLRALSSSMRVLFWFSSTATRFSKHFTYSFFFLRHSRAASLQHANKRSDVNMHISALVESHDSGVCVPVLHQADFSLACDLLCVLLWAVHGPRWRCNNDAWWEPWWRGADLICGHVSCGSYMHKYTPKCIIWQIWVKFVLIIVNVHVYIVTLMH